MRLFAILSVVCAASFLWPSQALPVPSLGSLYGDYDENGIVSHADYSILGDTFGDTVIAYQGADGSGNGLIDNDDFDVYRQYYGTVASYPSILPLTITHSPLLSGDVQWIIAFSNVNGALAGHLDIQITGANVLSAVAGPKFHDDGFNPIGVPGPKDGNVVEGIHLGPGEVFAALGTTLGSSFSNDTLEFLTVITEGLGETTLKVLAGTEHHPLSEYGYKGQDYRFLDDQSATFPGVAIGAVPEPVSLLVWSLLAGIGLAKYRRR